MTTAKSGARVQIGDRPSIPEEVTVDSIILDKPVSEMGEDERQKARDRVLAQLALRAGQGKDATFECVVDNPDFPEYTGMIQFKRPSMDDERRVGIRTAAYLNGQVGVDVKTENLAIFFATFEVCVIWTSAPEWFKPREMPSSAYGLLNFVYTEYANWLRTFRQYVPRERVADSAAPAV